MWSCLEVRPEICLAEKVVWQDHPHGLVSLSYALLPLLTKKALKTFILCYIEQTPVVRYLNALLSHYLYETAMGYFLCYNGNSTGQLHNRIMATKKNEYLSLRVSEV